MGNRLREEKDALKCAICKKGQTEKGTTTVTLDHAGTTVVFKNVPAEVCQSCGETYVDQKTTDALLLTLRNAEDAHVQVDVREFEAGAAEQSMVGAD